MSGYRSFHLKDTPPLTKGGVKEWHRAYRKVSRTLRVEHILFDLYRPRSMRATRTCIRDLGPPGRRDLRICLAAVMICGPRLPNFFYRMLRKASEETRLRSRIFINLATMCALKRTRGLSMWLARATSDLKPFGEMPKGLTFLFTECELMRNYKKKLLRILPKPSRWGCVTYTSHDAKELHRYYLRRYSKGILECQKLSH